MYILTTPNHLTSVDQRSHSAYKYTCVTYTSHRSVLMSYLGKFLSCSKLSQKPCTIVQGLEPNFIKNG